MSFHPPSLRELYNRPYTEESLEWRKVGARDKVHNLLQLVTTVGAEIATVLEFGCGTGAVINALSLHLGRELVGIDVGAPGRDQETPLSGVRYEQYDGVRSSFADGSFDLVYATHVLEHVLDERSFLHELRRVARQYIYIEVPCELHVRTSQRALQQSLDIGHINAYTPESFALTLETSGLAVKRLEVFDHSYASHRFHNSSVKALAKTAVRRAVLRLHRTLATRLMTYHVGALCTPTSLI
ncbi:MAG: class I SAM-dependent methyltransferase [Kofleriaceae bacterium]